MMGITNATASSDSDGGASLEAIYPVGSIYTSTVSTNPADLFGFGTWVAFGAGRVLIGAGTGTDSNSTQQTFSAGNTGGEYSHTLSTGEMPSHSHSQSSHSHSFGSHSHIDYGTVRIIAVLHPDPTLHHGGKEMTEVVMMVQLQQIVTAHHTVTQSL